MGLLVTMNLGFGEAKGKAVLHVKLGKQGGNENRELATISSMYRDTHLSLFLSLSLN